jgi:transcription elongation factor Elf1
MVVMTTPAHTEPTCPLCAEALDAVDYVAHGYEETVYVCERCDVRLSPEAVAELADEVDG